MPRTTNLSSSVSMFIEDSRVTAVANADVNPRNPSCFYTISSFAHSPNISVQSQVPGVGIPPSGNTNRNIPRGFPCSQQTIACYNNPSQQPLYQSTPNSCQGSGGNSRRASSSKPREIIHKIIRECSPEDQSGVPDEEWTQCSSHTSSRKSSGPSNVNFNISTGGSSSFHPNNSSHSNNTVNNPLNSTSPSAPGISGSGVSSIPPNPSQRPRVRTATLSLEPVISMINVKESIANVADDRTYTSVNLTLRSPTTGTTKIFPNVNSVVDVETCGSIGGGSSGTIRIPGHGGNSLTYSSYSNSRDGFESQLQIHIGPHGGTISASRRRNQNISIQQMNADLISAQLERKEKLMGALSSEKTRLAKLRQEITLLRTKLHPLRDLERLKEENQRLRMECDFMTKEVDLYDNGSVPLGETSEEFYRGINPGQDAHELFGFNHNNNRRMLGFGAENERPTLFNAEVDQWVRGMPPPRPPPPRFLPLPPQIDSPNGEWCCSMCTFRNHPDLAHCEQCGMVRVKPPTSSPASMSMVRPGQGNWPN